MPNSALPALFVVAGLAGATAAAGPAPAPEAAQLQLRAISHRFIDSILPGAAEVLDALIHTDFLFTRDDGAWLQRDEFMAWLCQRAPAHGATLEDEPVRLFGPVALVHGLYACASCRLRYTDVYLWGGSGWRLISSQDTPWKEGVAPALFAGVAPVHAAWRGQDPAGDDLAVLSALNEHYVRSFRESDVAWYDTHLAPDFVVISSDGSYKDRAAALAAFALPTFAETLQSFPVERVQVRQFGNLAVIHASNVYALKDGRTGESRYTDIWRRRGGQWRCVAAHITAHTSPGSAPR